MARDRAGARRVAELEEDSAGEAADEPGDMLALVREVPDGFRAHLDPPRRTLRIEYRRRGMGCLMLFLCVWLTGWTAGGVFAIAQVLQDGEPFLYFWLCGWAVGEVFVAFMLSWFLFGRTVITLDPHEMRVEKLLFGHGRRWSERREEVRSVRQVQDGGQGDDSFPSWGLKVRGRQGRSALSRQEYEKSQWLGRVIALWSGAPFTEAEPD
jgi:hypothetical protein